MEWRSIDDDDDDDDIPIYHAFFYSFISRNLANQLLVCFRFQRNVPMQRS